MGLSKGTNLIAAIWSWGRRPVALGTRLTVIPLPCGGFALIFMVANGPLTLHSRQQDIGGQPAASVTRASKGAISLLPPSFFTCLSALCSGTLTLQTESFWPFVSGFWLGYPVGGKVDSGGQERECWGYFSPLPTLFTSMSPSAGVISTITVPSGDLSFMAQALRLSRDRNTISSPNPFSLGVVKAFHCC